jgi:ADP-ribose pyrophosphatase YjhB (NUDIX family)
LNKYAIQIINSLNFEKRIPMDILTLLDEIQIIARNGLNYSEDVYDRERYGRLLGLAASTYNQILDIPEETIKERFRGELGHITPKIGADAAIFNGTGEILLMDRSDGSGWCLPCGWVEPNETPAGAAKREAFEETGLIVEPRQLVGAFTRLSNQVNGPHSLVAIVFLCDIVGGELILSQEGSALKFWSIQDVSNWHATHERYARAAYQVRQASQVLPAKFD